MLARGLQIRFGISCRADNVDRALFERLKKAGLRTVFIGVESGVQRQLDDYQKGITVEQNRAAIKVLQGLGLKVDAGFILFDPYLSLEEAEENLRFLRDTQLYRAESGLYNLLVFVYPFPGTPLQHRLSQEDRLNVGEVAGGLTQVFRYEYADDRVTALYDLVLPFYNRLLQTLDEVQDRLTTSEQSGRDAEGARLRRWLDNLGLFGLTLMERAIARIKAAPSLSTARTEGAADLAAFASQYAARFFPDEQLRETPLMTFRDLATPASNTLGTDPA